MSAVTAPPGTDDPWDRRLALGATGLLATFNRADVLHAADVQVAQRLGVLVGEERDPVLLGLALAVRAARNGSVCVDLATVADLPLDDDATLPWPEPRAWADACAAGPLVEAGLVHLTADGDARLLYLDRYHREEGQVAAALLDRAAQPPPDVDDDLLATGLDRLYPDDRYVEQREAVAASVRRWTTVLTGGPGTGKTTTVARLLVLLAEQHEGATGRPPRIAMCAPTAKASVRLKEAVAESARDLGEVDRARLDDVPSTTLHRLLGWRGGGTRFRHDRGNRLPHDVVVVDETSMLSLTHMARLLEALRDHTRLVLVGDPDQLASVEAGAVLADLVRGFADRAADTPVSRLRTTHRYGARIGALADAIRDGETERVLDLLHSGASGVAAAHPDDDSAVTLVDPDDAEAMAAFRRHVAESALAARLAAEAGDGRAAVTALESHRLLCAHREGPFGVAGWNRTVERMLTEETGVAHYDLWYAGRPVLVTANDYGLDLYNGDLGITVREPDGRLRVVIKGAAGLREVATTRLADVETVYATTVHKAQGSQADEVSVVLPPDDSRLLTRELLYTAVTRAQRLVRVVGTDDAIRAAVERQVQRASGLAGRLARRSEEATATRVTPS